MEELLGTMTAAELTYWIEFSYREPWGYEIESQRMGTVASTVVNCTPRGSGAKASRPTDFYLSLNPPKEEGGFSAEQLEFIKKKRKKQPKR